MKSVQYGVFSGPYFPAFGLNKGKHGPEKTLCLDTFHAVSILESILKRNRSLNKQTYSKNVKILINLFKNIRDSSIILIL